MATDATRPKQPALNRRGFLGSLAIGVPAAWSTRQRHLWGAEPTNSLPDESFAGVITRQTSPDNFEFPFHALNSFLTPNEQFFVRSHFAVPEIDAKEWRLTIDGEVEHPYELTYDQLRQMDSQTVTSLLECSGNGRAYLKPPQIGIRWEQGGVGNAEWTGVPLAAVLERAGLKDGAVAVILEGADRGTFEPPNPPTPGVINYSHSLTLPKAQRPEVLLAYEMNGLELQPDHGHPVRVVVPGWYGMASVKWLQRAVVIKEPFHGYFESFAYSIWDRRKGIPTLVPVTDIQPKAQIARPALLEVVSAGSQYRIFGAAWSGEADVKQVVVSTDGGEAWSEAKLLDLQVPFAWRMWEYEWPVPKRIGHYKLMARATDSRNRVQPLERDNDRRDAVINHIQTIQVSVR